MKKSGLFILAASRVWGSTLHVATLFVYRRSDFLPDELGQELLRVFEGTR